jgi:uncharacterized protein (DUF2141 family)
MKRLFLLFFPLPAVLVVLAVLVGPAFSAELNVTVSGLRSSLGEVHVAVYNAADRFPKDGEYLTTAVVAAAAGKVTVTFKDLAAGNYALAVYHDENGNDKFDQGIFGIPLEGYGFSNAASAFFGPPDFAAAAVTLAEPASNITIRMTYW